MPASRELMEMAAMLLRRLELLPLAMIAVGIMARPLSSEAEPTKTFKSEAYGFSVQYPSSWHTLSLGGVFYIQSFPSSRAVRGDVLPSGGAAIKLLVPEQILHGRRDMPKNLAEWSSLGTSRQSVDNRRSVDVSDGKRTLPVVDIVTHCCSEPPFQESTAWYFEIEGHMFVATVTYWKGDPAAQKHLQILKGVVLSLKLDPPIR